MSATSRDAPLIIDFDPDDQFAAYEMISVMCGLDRATAVPTLGADLIADYGDAYTMFFDDIERTVRYHQPPPPDALDDIIEDCALGNDEVRAELMRVVEALATPATGRCAEFSLAARFWHSVIPAALHHELPTLTQDVWTTLLHPGGGLRAILRSPSSDELSDKIWSCVTGYPMMSGLSLYLAAILDRHHGNLSSSYQHTYHIMNEIYAKGVSWPPKTGQVAKRECRP
jgi:hypothetical protein